MKDAVYLKRAARQADSVEKRRTRHMLRSGCVLGKAQVKMLSDPSSSPAQSKKHDQHFLFCAEGWLSRSLFSSDGLTNTKHTNACMHTHTQTHACTLYRLIGVKDNVINSNILKREMSCVCFFKEERVLTLVTESEYLMPRGRLCSRHGGSRVKKCESRETVVEVLEFDKACV